jgi:hypothetical protein
VKFDLDVLPFQHDTPDMHGNEISIGDSGRHPPRCLCRGIVVTALPQLIAINDVCQGNGSPRIPFLHARGAED